MRPSSAQIARVVENVVKRLVALQLVQLSASEDVVRTRLAALLTRNFDEEAEIEREAVTEAARLVRQGAPGVRRDELDLRRVEQLVKQRIAQARGFAL